MPRTTKFLDKTILAPFRVKQPDAERAFPAHPPRGGEYITRASHSGFPTTRPTTALLSPRGPGTYLLRIQKKAGVGFRTPPSLRGFAIKLPFVHSGARPAAGNDQADPPFLTANRSFIAPLRYTTGWPDEWVRLRP